MAADEHPYDRILRALDDRGLLTGRSCRVSSQKSRARCPTHSDQRASLVITRTDNRALLHCFANCRTADVLAALGLRMADLFTHRSGAAPPIAVVAEYEYIDLNGELVARKLRYSNKTFRWQRPGRQPGTWVWNLQGVAPGLYRLPELEGVPQVFLNEGEKATDLMRTLGLPATCPPCGASMWLPAWSNDLRAAGCRELVILADADRPGDQHAERVAAMTALEQITVKVVRLPGLQNGADAFDWLHGGHTPADLLNVAAEAAVWVQGTKEQARLERKRALTRERQRRLRNRRRIEIVRHAVNVQTGREVA